MNKTTIKRLLVSTVIVALIITAIIWALTHSFINITTTGGAAGTTTYKVTNQATGVSSSATKTGASFKKLVKHGDYQIEVIQGHATYVTVVKTGSIFHTAKVTARLQNEKSRSFVGNNPGLCMIYAASTLLSNNCGGKLASTKTHIPATNTTPTFTVGDNTLIASNEGFVSTTEGDFLMVLQPVSEDGSQMHMLYSLQANPGAADSFVHVLDMPQLDATKTYAIKNYKNGFIVYNLPTASVYYYASVKNQPEKVKLEQAINPLLVGSHINVGADSFSVLYTNLQEVEKIGPEKLESEVEIHTAVSASHFTFKTPYTAAYACETARLCMLDGQRLDVFDIASQKPKLIYSVTGIRSVQNEAQGKLVLGTTGGLLNFNIANRDGYYLYALGPYIFNSMVTAPDGFIANVSGSDGKRIALHINTSQDDTDSIDKKIYYLQKVPEIKSVSVYKSFIFVTPNVGKVTFNNNDGFFGYDPTTKKNANAKITAAIRDIGIDTNTYTIINTLP